MRRHYTLGSLEYGSLFNISLGLKEFQNNSNKIYYSYHEPIPYKNILLSKLNRFICTSQNHEHYRLFHITKGQSSGVLGYKCNAINAMNLWKLPIFIKICSIFIFVFFVPNIPFGPQNNGDYYFDPKQLFSWWGMKAPLPS